MLSAPVTGAFAREKVKLRRTHFEPADSQEMSGFGGASPSRGATSPVQKENGWLTQTHHFDSEPTRPGSRSRWRPRPRPPASDPTHPTGRAGDFSRYRPGVFPKNRADGQSYVTKACNIFRGIGKKGCTGDSMFPLVPHGGRHAQHIGHKYTIEASRPLSPLGAKPPFLCNVLLGIA